jgi:hypothetical protein
LPTALVYSSMRLCNDAQLHCLQHWSILRCGCAMMRNCIAYSIGLFFDAVVQ